MPNFVWVLVIAVVIAFLILTGFDATFSLAGHKVTVTMH